MLGCSLVDINMICKVLKMAMYPLIKWKVPSQKKREMESGNQLNKEIEKKC